jgi:hypothetical protein
MLLVQKHTIIRIIAPKHKAVRKETADEKPRDDESGVTVSISIGEGDSEPAEAKD